MQTPNRENSKSSLERKALNIISIIFFGVIVAAWVYAMNLRQTISASNSITNVDVRALIEIERLRNSAESQISNSRSYFLLGTKGLLDEQKKDKQTLMDSLVNFEKQYALPKVPEIIKRIEGLEQQEQEIFDQAMKYREQQTETRIVGQFYHSKTAPIRTHLNGALDEIEKIQTEELNRARARAKEATVAPQIQIPRGMAWLTGLMTFLFLTMALLVLRMLRERDRQVAERDRLYEEARKAVQSRDEVISAVSEDLKDPLSTIYHVAEAIPGDGSEVIRSSVLVTEGLVKDIVDQKKADMGSMTLRLDQLPVDLVLDDARMMLQPLAKQRDVKLQFDSVNPPVLAFVDRERVMRVLANLIGNAIKFSPKHGRVVVKVRSDQQFVYVSVTDNGPGIPEKQLPEIFEHFWQARKTADQGAGIGLAVVKTIVEAHGGTVRVDSHMGHGSTFTFSLPRRRPVGANLGRPAPMTVRQSPRPRPLDFRDGPSH